MQREQEQHAIGLEHLQEKVPVRPNEEVPSVAALPEQANVRCQIIDAQREAVDGIEKLPRAAADDVRRAKENAKEGRVEGCGTLAMDDGVRDGAQDKRRAM